MVIFFSKKGAFPKKIGVTPGLAKIMEGEKLVKNIYRAEVEGNRGRGRPRRRWMDRVKGRLSERGLSIPEAEECVKDRREWRRIVWGRRR